MGYQGHFDSVSALGLLTAGRYQVHLDFFSSQIPVGLIVSGTIIGFIVLNDPYFQTWLITYDNTNGYER